jgi:hypothetical protein
VLLQSAVICCFNLLLLVTLALSRDSTVGMFLPAQRGHPRPTGRVLSRRLMGCIHFVPSAQPQDESFTHDLQVAGRS